jgi:hypothetical protein
MLRNRAPHVSTARRLAAAIVAGICSLHIGTKGFSQHGTGIPRDGFDPPSALVPHAHTPPALPPRQLSAGILPVGGKLVGFGVGEPMHSSGHVFAEGIAAQLRQVASRSSRTLHIRVTGGADGIPNSGLRNIKQALPAVCQSAVRWPVDDPGLALLRACVVSQQLTDMLRLPVLDIVWERRIHDEPDGSKRGDLYRYVEVEVRQ